MVRRFRQHGQSTNGSVPITMASSCCGATAGLGSAGEGEAAFLYCRFTVEEFVEEDMALEAFSEYIRRERRKQLRTEELEAHYL
jgi:hypothetical protein